MSDYSIKTEIPEKPGRSKLHFCSFFLIFLFSFFSCWAWSFNPDRLFPQNLKEPFWESLKLHPERTRALFLSCIFSDNVKTKTEILYARYAVEKDEYIIAGKIDSDTSALVDTKIFNLPPGLFSPQKQNGKPLYSRGLCLKGAFDSKRAVYSFVPYKSKTAFISDLGYLEIRFKASTDKCADLCGQVFTLLFNGSVSIKKSVPLNKYYLFRDNYFGHVDEYYTEGMDFVSNTSLINNKNILNNTSRFNHVFFPVHKITFYKFERDHNKKALAEARLTTDMIFKNRFLLSQDERLKRGMVPGWVKLNLKRLAQTDIGSGQNHLVFLSIGSGINYFDDPWKAERENIPSPRFVFSNYAMYLKKLQIYPSYSIDSGKTGRSRLGSINRWQYPEIMDQGVIPDSSDRYAQWASLSWRKIYLKSLEQALVSYGVLNDSVDLEPGFRFLETVFNGNIVNNEVRVMGALNIPGLCRSVIVPNGYLKEYVKRAPDKKNPITIFGTSLFTEAFENSDKGFRATYLSLILKESHPVIYSIMNRSLKKEALKILSFIDTLAKEQGPDFFKTKYMKFNKKRKTQALIKKLELLESTRNKMLKRPILK